MFYIVIAPKKKTHLEAFVELAAVGMTWCLICVKLLNFLNTAIMPSSNNNNNNNNNNIIIASNALFIYFDDVLSLLSLPLSSSLLLFFLLLLFLFVFAFLFIFGNLLGMLVICNPLKPCI